MSLKTEIDKTNDLKNKTKKAKTNIDNKLVELGGENANNLADVPSKMQGMIGQYKKFAKGGKQKFFVGITNKPNEFKVEMNLDFTPQIIFCNVWRTSYYEADRFCGTADSRYNINDGNDKVNDEWVNSYFAQFKIKEGSISKKDFTLLLSADNGERDFAIAWTAIG